MAAIAVSALISGPASAIEDDVIYSGSKAVTIWNGSGCSSHKDKDQSMSILMTPNIEFDGLLDVGKDTGYWFAEIFDIGDIEDTGNGPFMISKPGKTVKDAPKKATMDLSRNTFIEITTEMGVYAASACKNFDEFAEDSTQIKKFEAKWSKNGEKLKVNLEVESNYLNDKGNLKKVKFKVNSKQLDRGVINN
jgi:hypothetical protein